VVGPPGRGFAGCAPVVPVRCVSLHECVPWHVVYKPLKRAHTRVRLCVARAQARNLLNVDTIGKSDPYVVCEVGTSSQRTAIVKNCLNPVFREW
jgi:Ca2+-dependent lipid-binding protein